MKSLLLFSCKNGIFGDKFVSEIWHGELILSAKMISCHQSIFFKTVTHRIITRSQNTIRLTDTNEQVIEYILDTVRAPIE